MTFTLLILKEKVYGEVAQTTSYTGAKMEGDPKAYDRIFTTDEDRSQLERFWTECSTAVCEKLKKYLVAEQQTESGFKAELVFSSSFDSALLPSFERDLFSFFVSGIVAKWYAFTNKKEAGEYAAAAQTFLEGAHRKACYKRKPSRPVYN